MHCSERKGENLYMSQPAKRKRRERSSSQPLIPTEKQSD